MQQCQVSNFSSYFHIAYYNILNFHFFIFNYFLSYTLTHIILYSTCIRNCKYQASQGTFASKGFLTERDTVLRFYNTFTSSKFLSIENIQVKLMPENCIFHGFHIDILLHHILLYHTALEMAKKISCVSPSMFRT